ncbi:hypothetical protein K470DRAFT_256965 [Piedraia hortae CBS 480.64]|uniref:Malate dehydrogenase n=1 Tax=Piedraia hortae CBS 480.64 TaxID=1314780 RepID=A0A6A7C1L6_9PEZI|nr:hypothetical protein K470DRAFT_256965 [Piedraia hortae CBS 480.64]
MARLFIAITLLSSIVASLPTQACNASPTLPLGEVANSGPSPLPTLSGPPKFIALGLGTQNYTCNSTTGNYTSTGALARLFDAKPYLTRNKNEVQSLPRAYLDRYLEFPCSQQPSDCSEEDEQCEELVNASFQPLSLRVLGEHYFDSAGVPTFDLYKGQGHPLLHGKKTGESPAPSKEDVHWLYLTCNGSTDDRVVSSVYRVETAGGVPPDSCSGDGSIVVPYAAEYWFYT